MAGQVEARLKELGIELPPVSAPAANYIPYVVTGNLVFVAGQIPFVDGKPGFLGKLGQEFSVEDGQKSARTCGLALIAVAKEAAGGDLDRVRVVKLGGFVNCTPDFADHPKVINGASDLMVEVFGDEKGKHARFALGVANLPLNVATEIDAVFELS